MDIFPIKFSRSSAAIHTLWALTIILGMGCFTKNEGELPWVASTFATPLVTKFTLINQTSQKHAVSFWPQWRLVGTDQVIPDSLSVGDSLELSLDLYRPESYTISLGHWRAASNLLPGFDHKIVHSDSGAHSAGPNAGVYAAMDSMETWFTSLMVRNEFSLSLDEFCGLRSRELAAAKQALEKLDQPAWLKEVLIADAELRHAAQLLSYVEYHRFFYDMRVVLPKSVLSAVDSLLANNHYQSSTSYREVYDRRAVYVAATAAPDSVVVSSAEFQHAAKSDSYQKDPVKATDLTGVKVDYLAYLIRIQRDFTGRDQILENLMNDIPAETQLALEDLQTRVSESSTRQKAMASLLQTPLLTNAEDSASMLSSRSSGMTLYKFWFAGCYPCLMQYPHEQALLEQVTNLDLVYVAFKTPNHRWLPYMAKYPPPTDHHLYLPDNELAHLTTALGTLAAPQYMLIDANGKIVCSNCPKPNDPKLAALLKGRR